MQQRERPYYFKLCHKTPYKCQGVREVRSDSLLNAYAKVKETENCLTQIYAITKKEFDEIINGKK
jgi:hypothetical protein